MLALYLLALLTAGAQPPEPKLAPTKAGACGGVNWACAAQCVDRKCAQDCLGPTCTRALESLENCARGACVDAEHCASDACRKTCVETYGPPAAFPEGKFAKARDVCDTLERFGGVVDKALVGKWELSAATVGIPRREMKRQDPGEVARADFQRWVRFTASGCFVQETTLKMPTLKPGNDMVIRSWGTAKQKGKKLDLEVLGGQAIGALCGEGFVSTPKPAEKPRPSTFEIELEGEGLTLTSTTDEKQTFKFQKNHPDGGYSPR